MIRTCSYFALAMVFCLASCGEPKMATLSVIIENKSQSGEDVVAMKFPNSPEIFIGWVAPKRGHVGDHGVSILPPHDQVMVRLQSDAGARREFTLNLQNMGQVNTLNRIEYHLEINDQGMRVVPPAEWPKPVQGPAQQPPADLGPMPPGLVPGNEPPPEKTPSAVPGP